MTSLKKLFVRGSCGIDQKGIQGLNLVELDASNNGKITNVSIDWTSLCYYDYTE